MKKRIRKTGEIVDVIAYASPLGAIRCQDDNVSYIDSKGIEHDREYGLNYHWDFEDAKERLSTGIDWEQRRYEIQRLCCLILGTVQMYGCLLRKR